MEYGKTMLLSSTKVRINNEAPSAVRMHKTPQFPGFWEGGCSKFS